MKFTYKLCLGLNLRDLHNKTAMVEKCIEQARDKLENSHL